MIVTRRVGSQCPFAQGSHRYAAERPLVLTSNGRSGTPGSYQRYINVHTKAHLGGEIRGQVVPPKS